MQSYWSLVEDARDYFYPIPLIIPENNVAYVLKNKNSIKLFECFLQKLCVIKVQKIKDDLHFVRKRHIS